MSANDYWELAYKNEEFKHWESAYPSPEQVALIATKMLPSDAKILDVGSGGGNDAIFMAQCGFHVIGLDISTAAIKIAEERAKRALVKVDQRRGNVLELPIGDTSIDLVTDRGLFHLILDTDRPKYVDQFNPVTEEAITKYFSSL